MLLLPWFINIGKNDLTGGSIVRPSLRLVSPHVSSLLPIVRNNRWGLMLLFTLRRFNLAENESSSDDQGFSIVVCLCVLFIWCFLGEIYVLLSFGTYLSHALVKSQVDKFQTRLWLRFTREDSEEWGLNLCYLPKIWPEFPDLFWLPICVGQIVVITRLWANTTCLVLLDQVQATSDPLRSIRPTLAKDSLLWPSQMLRWSMESRDHLAKNISIIHFNELSRMNHH